MRKLIVVIVLAAVLMAVRAEAQTAQDTVLVGQIVRLAFEAGSAESVTPVAGRTIQHKVYVDGAHLPTVVFGPPNPTTRTIEFQIPPFTAQGPHTLRVGALYAITDPARWMCGGTFVVGGPTPIDCTEVFSNTLALTAATAPAPVPPPPAPSGLRIVITPSMATDSNKLLGVHVAVTDDAGALLSREFVPVASVTGKTLLSTATVITIGGAK